MDSLQDYRNAVRILDLQAIIGGPERVVRDGTNPFELFRDEEFFGRFRFSKHTVIYIINLIEYELMPEANRYYAAPPHLQVLIALQCFATGAFQIPVGDLVKVTQATVSRIVKRVAVSLARRKNSFIKFPNRHNVVEVMQEFHDISNIPTVIGAIDCTHVKVKNPGGEDPLRYINRIQTILICRIT